MRWPEGASQEKSGRVVIADSAGRSYLYAMDEIGSGKAFADDRTLPTVCHLLGLASLTGIPLANVLAPLGLWLWKREGDPRLDAHGREVVNFQISFAIYLILAAISFFFLIGMVLFPLVLIAHIVLTIMGAVKASNGVFYRYPLTIRLL